ncbi:putative pumilio-like 7, chloroplastic, partial [Mucuna pruriens]
VPVPPSAPPSYANLWLDPEPSTLLDSKWGHDLSLADDLSKMSLFDGILTDIHPYTCFNETGTLPYHHHVNGAAAGVFDKGYTFGTPNDHANHIYHNLVDHRRNQQQGTGSSTSYQQVVRDRYVASSQSLGGVKSPVRFSPITSLNSNVHSPRYYVAAKEKAEPHLIPPRRVGGEPAAFRCDNSFIIQGRDVKHCFDNGYSSTRGYGRNLRDEPCVGGTLSRNFSPAQNNPDFSLPMLLDFYSPPDVQCYIYNLAKDQNGCRFLQRMVDEGSYQDTCMVFDGIIASVVELMIDSFGNYLVQKLLDVCTDDQRLQIVLMLTNHPGQLVRISLNSHGTRVVQKLIETLNSADQISLVKSAIQPGFLDLIKDLNGNHVIQRCLQCLSCQDNQFIFDAAVKFCVEIATHRHGCCVLQRCIDYSVGKNRDKLVTEICKHGLFLSQDPFGNYVVQYVIETDTVTASAKLLGQFRGNYVTLSAQKFSSHVVEKCLKHIGDSRSKIVRELLSAPHFEQLLQDPYANYVIQSALTVTKGPLHASLVEAVRPHKILRTSPYCKRIFSGSLLK